MNSKTQQILVVQTAFLGDLILNFPFFRELKRLFPESNLVVVVRKGLGAFAQEQSAADQVFEVEKNQSQSYREVKKKLQPISWDYIFCPHPSLRSAVWVGGLKAKHKVGFQNFWNGFIFNRRVPRLENGPEAIRVLSLLCAIEPSWQKKINHYIQHDWYAMDPYGLLNPIPEELSLAVEASRGHSSSQGPEPRTAKFNDVLRVAIFPGSVWATKQWKKEHFEEIGKWLIEKKNAQVYWLGSASESGLCGDLATRVRGSIFFQQELSSKRTSSLSQVVDFLKTVHLVISNDSGGQHLAALSGTRVLSIFGPTVLKQGFRPWTTKSAVAELSGLRCRPCGAHGHKKCPIQTHECMEKLYPKRVQQVIEHLLVAGKTKGS